MNCHPPRSTLFPYTTLFRSFELLHRRGIVVRAQDQIELGAEIADRLVIAGELLGRRQRAQRFADFAERALDRKSTRLNSSHRCISYAVFCLKKKKKINKSHT